MNTPVEVLTECARRGILLTATPDGRIRYEAPRGALTPELREALGQHKATLLPILRRLEGMRAHGVDLTGRGTAPPTPVVVWPRTPGGPGRCASCGAPLDNRQAYGRCAPCAVAAEVFWATRRPRPEEIAPPRPRRPADRDAPQIVAVPHPRGGVLAVPRQAVELAFDLEARGFVLELVDDDLQLVPEAALTPADRTALTRWWRHIAALVEVVG